MLLLLHCVFLKRDFILKLQSFLLLMPVFCAAEHVSHSYLKCKSYQGTLRAGSERLASRAAAARAARLQVHERWVKNKKPK